MTRRSASAPRHLKTYTVFKIFQYVSNKNFNFSSACDYRGVMNETDGNCTCKDLVQGGRCDHCLQGHWNLKQDNPKGCQSK